MYGSPSSTVTVELISYYTGSCVLRDEILLVDLKSIPVYDVHSSASH